MRADLHSNALYHKRHHMQHQHLKQKQSFHCLPSTRFDNKAVKGDFLSLSLSLSLSLFLSLSFCLSLSPFSLSVSLSLSLCLSVSVCPCLCLSLSLSLSKLLSYHLWIVSFKILTWALLTFIQVKQSHQKEPTFVSHSVTSFRS